ncbi:MAG: PAS domain-containing sensor histidine kinase, partial [Gemmataceae bacterium]
LAKGDGGGSTSEFLGVLKTEISRLNGVLERFGSFASLERLEIQSTDVVGVIESAVRLIRPQAAEQGVDVQIVKPMGLLLTLIDPERFKEALLNLLINALEAMPGGGHLTVTIKQEGQGFQTIITDTGSGIPPEIQRRFFQPFFSTKPKGTGMGLALSEKLIGQHGGHISYRTGPEGTTFEISMPLEESRIHA